MSSSLLRIAAVLALVATPTLTGCVGEDGLPTLPGGLGSLGSGFSITINADPSTRYVSAGQTESLTVSINNPAGTAVQVTWNASGGSLSSRSGSAVTWTAPSSPGDYTVSVSATNGTDEAPGEVRFTVQ